MFENTTLPDVIELKNVSQSYDGGKSFVIKDLNLLVEEKRDHGQFISILGPSGCGKSTILRFICGLQKPTGGEVKIYGKPREDERIGMVFQKYSSFDWLTVKQNLELAMKLTAGKVDRDVIAAMIKRVGLEGHENKYAQYPTLSGGQLQRVAIARSLLANPRILLMDEPFGALDIYTRARMQELLQDVFLEMAGRQTSMTVLFVTHDVPEAVFLSDKIWIMSTAPARIAEVISLDALPTRRTRDIKRTPLFNAMVQTVEDKLLALIKETK